MKKLICERLEKLIFEILLSHGGFVSGITKLFQVPGVTQTGFASPELVPLPSDKLIKHSSKMPDFAQKLRWPGGVVPLIRQLMVVPYPTGVPYWEKKRK